ncbi:hypothetical protein PUW24_00745 (plasmid) [Paenibacillus urinalis]|uniref:Uncharacterized protein n=1 Tax=Paenibacillus urinalis TaxID=521520 RepID=A0AAX3N6K5_9BACL|nr:MULTISPECIES: hypothetical protein [Paenibacillus]MCM3130556.1 hypothetical protein [Paenibacillus sp. MER 78]WDH85443.1 hypothetical protein PUW23_25745 [Paenibacillus urinalis]WDH95118.1 hypothetical protein PUW24_00745 [Paenibacillus urinalis]WDI05409.1 hypothetical protein PUW25_26820 [Paenibacillus urinalis]
MLSIGLNSDDIKIVKDYALLPILLDVLEKDWELLCRSDIKTLELTRVMIERLQNAAMSDLTSARKLMREKNLKVYEYRKTNHGVELQYVSKGYHRKLSMLWGLIEAEIEQRSYNYLGFEREQL